jgi:hypothetical protein
MPLSLRASYCFSFLTFAFLFGMAWTYPRNVRQNRWDMTVGDTGV